MSNSSQYGLVFVTPELCSTKIELEEVQEALQALGFLGARFDSSLSGEASLLKGEASSLKGEASFLIGDLFLQQISFMGCSPQIVVEPPEPGNWSNFCHIGIQQLQQPSFFPGMNRLKYVCPHCRARPFNKLPDLTHWQPKQHLINCQKCTAQSWIEDLNWRHTAGFGEFFIIVHSVYPNEAVPTDQFLGQLKKLLGAHQSLQWDYFYYER